MTIFELRAAVSHACDQAAAYGFRLSLPGRTPEQREEDRRQLEYWTGQQALLFAARLCRTHLMPLAVAECIVQERDVSWTHLSDGTPLLTLRWTAPATA